MLHSTYTSVLYVRINFRALVHSHIIFGWLQANEAIKCNERVRLECFNEWLARVAIFINCKITIDHCVLLLWRSQCAK